jgi:hypothetical protein
MEPTKKPQSELVVAMQQWVLTHLRIIGEQLQSRVEGSEVPSVTNCLAMIPFYMGGGLAGSTTAM